ncbi:MAG: histidine kinase [Acidobacteriota bacterium]
MTDSFPAGCRDTSMPTSSPWRGSKTWALILGGWAVLSLVLAPEVYVYFLLRGQDMPWAQIIELTATSAAITAVYAPLIVWLTWRFPLERRVWPRSLIVHVPACLVFTISHSWLYAMICYASPELSHMLFARFNPNLITYWAIVGFTTAINYFEKYKERERQLAQAQLQLLKAQLHPHFLFNTLNTISAMMHEDVKAADRMVSRLSDLLRLILDNIGHHEASLRQEIEFVQKYVEIERIRFGDKLALIVDLDPALLDARVPSMLLQPLVENCIRHGFAGRKHHGSISIEGRRDDGFLVLRIADNGCGLPAGSTQPPPEGLGLGNTRRRLEQLYPAAHRLTLESAQEGGLVVSLRMPLQMAGPEPAGGARP